MTDVKDLDVNDDNVMTMKIVLNSAQADKHFINLFNRMIDLVHTNAEQKGFWETPNVGEKISLVHSELSEALESFRIGLPVDSHLPEFSNAEVELADAVIRIMDLAKYYNLKLSDAVVAKHKYNLTRPAKHDKKF